MTLSLIGSVGTGGTNRPADVRALQTALAQASVILAFPALHPGPADGKSGDGTEGAVSTFQRYVCHAYRPDGRVDPNGTTARTLAAVLALADVRWRYPLVRPATAPFSGPGGGMRRFRWRRSSGKRAHAGVDLYAPVGTDVLAVDHGRVLRVAPFYLGTDVVEVEHTAPGGHRYVVRYGEVVKARVKAGDMVERGQVLADVGRLRGLSFSMLHLEMYLGTETGALTRTTNAAVDRVNGRPFQRRRDLTDPTPFLLRAPLP